jgi:hypothetical protein
VNLIFIRNRDILRKKQEIEFFKKWRNIAPNNIIYQEEVETGLQELELELHLMEKENAKWNKMF